jgi:hypothetical protein
MQKDNLPTKQICLFLLLLGLLTSNTFAQGNYGTLELQVVAGKPAVFSDPPLTGGKYRASNAHVLIYPRDQPDSPFSYDEFTDKEGKLIVREVFVGPNKFEVSFIDMNGDLWRTEGLVYIKRGSWEKKLIELKKAT